MQYPCALSKLYNMIILCGVNYKDKLGIQAEHILQQLCEQFMVFETDRKSYDQQIEQAVSEDAMCQAILKIEGVGPITASAMVASIGDANAFKNGREVSAWLGLVPKQYSSGHTVRLSGITKRGDRYVRKLLIHGARSVINFLGNKKDHRSIWIRDKKERLGFNKAAVALANKNARIIWAVLKTGECYLKQELLAA